MVNHVAMSEVTITAVCDEREEGEIIEDDLEDVSDSSMFPSSPVDSGKSVSPELLSAVCLSSVSSSDYCRPYGRLYYHGLHHYKWKQRRKRKQYKRRRGSFYKNRRRPSVHVQSESDQELVDPNYAKQLKDALKHETPQELHNSLRSRLKAFIVPTSSHTDEENLTTLPDVTRLSTQGTVSTANENDNQDTNENKNKNLTSENFEDSELYELRMAALKSVVLEKHKQRKRKKENCTSEVCTTDINKENDCSILNNDTKNQVSIVADIVNKDPLIEEQPQSVDNSNHKEVVVEEDADILRAMLLASMTKTLTAVPRSTVTVNNFHTKQGTLERNLLAKHAIVNPLIININDDSDSDLETKDENKSFKETVTEFLKKQRAEVEKNTKNSESPDKSDDFLMDKSAMRLLSRSQQLEYRQLKQRLLNARKKGRPRKISQRQPENTASIKKTPKVKVSPNEKTVSPNVNGKVRNLPNLQKTLNELQIKKNGRLQMKGKYRSLGALLNKINHASNVRQQHELELKKLLHEIQKARVKVAVSHQNFTNLVQQLIKGKQIIDQSVLKSSLPFTSTPKSTVNKQLKKVNSVQESSNSNNSENTPNKIESVKVEEKMLLEPNDVTKIFVPQTDVLKYTSPLDNRGTNNINNPLTTLCPFDLLGTCKDMECKFVHCS